MINISMWNIIFTVVNLLILFVAMRIFFFKPIRKMLDKRQAEADELFDKAAQEEKDAEGLKAEYTQKIESIETEKKQILSEVRKKADEEHKKILADAKDEAEQIRSDASASAKFEHDEIIDNAKKEIADMVIEAASKIAAAGSPDSIDSKLYDKFINEAGDRS